MAKSPTFSAKDIEDVKRKTIFVPCESKESLKRWIKIFLDVDLPDATVDPDSNSSPMDLIWEIYKKALDNNDPDFNRILAYAARSSFKTLSASIIEVLMLVHIGRDCVHLAAIEEQSKKCKSYVNQFLSKPILREFVEDDNKREVQFIRYYNSKTGDSIPLPIWKKLPEMEKNEYKEIKNELKIVVCTLQSTNGQHASFMCVGGDTDVVIKSKDFDFKFIDVENLAYSILGKQLRDGVYEAKSGVHILGYDFELKTNVFKPITKVFIRKTNCLLLRLGNNKIVCSYNHKLFTNKGYKEAFSLEEGDLLYCIDGSWNKVNTIEHKKEQTVYDFTVDEVHNFFTNDILSSNCVDELDIIANPAAYEEAKMIPDMGAKKQYPITLLTSTRKFSYGIVQKELDEAHKSDLKIRHWNIIDVTEKCAPERHRPDLPKETIHYSLETFKSMPTSEFLQLTEEERSKYKTKKLYKGCGSCKLLPMCQGRLAEQKSQSISLKNIDSTINTFRPVSLPVAKAQLLCWTPSSEGLIYPSFVRETHMITPSQMAEKITGVPHQSTLRKTELIEIMKRHDVKFYAGMDHGFAHPFAVVVAGVIGEIVYVVASYAIPNFELPQKIAFCRDRIKKVFDPIIYADTADPSSNRSLKKSGLKIRDWTKEPGSVEGGIELVRAKIMSSLVQPNLYLLKDDDGCESLAKHMQLYHYKTDAQGKATGSPEEEDDDELDALRYLIMNVFHTRGKLGVPKEGAYNNAYEEGQQAHTEENWMQKKIEELTENDPNNSEGSVNDKGAIKWNW